MPPNSKQTGAFVYDPNMAEASEVEAQVELTFKDVANRETVCCRSLRSTKKVGIGEVCCTFLVLLSTYLPLVNLV